MSEIKKIVKFSDDGCKTLMTFNLYWFFIGVFGFLLAITAPFIRRFLFYSALILAASLLKFRFYCFIMLRYVPKVMWNWMK